VHQNIEFLFPFDYTTQLTLGHSQKQESMIMARTTRETITLKLPKSLYGWASRVAQATNQSVEAVVLDYVENSLPPLNDIPPDEVESLAELSLMDDAALWRASEVKMPVSHQEELTNLLETQNERALTKTEEKRLNALNKEYGQLMVQKAHAWLLLARRGYQVPPQTKKNTPR